MLPDKSGRRSRSSHHADERCGAHARDIALVRDQNDGVAALIRSSNSAMISSPVLESRLPVGSSARMIEGLFTSARAIGDALALTAG